MVADIGDPMGDTGTGAGDMVPETHRDSTKGTAQDLVANEVVTLVEETGITAEAEVREGGMVTTPTPPPPRRAENAGQRSELSGRR